MSNRTSRLLCAAAVAIAFLTPAGASAEPQISARLEKAKDYIADEQWLRAIEVLKAASVDPREKNKDEALFWLAHSQHQAQDLGAAVETIAQLERNFPTSRWVKPARSLRVELAQKLRRDDVLWWTATAPPQPMPAPTPPAMTMPPPPTGTRPRPPLPARSAPSGQPPAPRTPPAAVPFPTPPPTVWVSEHWAPDTDARILALGSLIQTDADRVIPLLRDIALDTGNTGDAAARAVFVLAQSGRPEAHSTVLELAKRASVPVSVAAVKELGRFGGPRVSQELLQVYTDANPRVKYQVVNSLGERSATMALFQIAQSEPDAHLRDTAIVTLGQAGGRMQLQRLYGRGRIEWKRPIIVGLFNARAEEELIQIADRETDPAIRREILNRLRLLGTPKAKAYVAKEQSR